METKRKSCAFFLIGGAADTCYASFLKLSGGADAKILVVPHASGVPQESADAVQEGLHKAGASDVNVVMPGSPFTIPDGTKSIFIAGGDQSRLVSLLGWQGLELLKAFSKAGGLIAGTSAGAACMGDHMILDGMKDGVIRPGALLLGSGLGLFPGVVFDTHFLRRARFNRPVVALAQTNARLVVGLDEDTGVHIVNGKATVIGAGHVWVYRRGPRFKSDISKQVGSASNVNVSILSAGDSFKL